MCDESVEENRTHNLSTGLSQPIYGKIMARPEFKVIS